MEKMKLKGNVLERIEAMRGSATKAEKQLISAIMKFDSKSIIYMSVTELADLAGVAEATIVRFCRKLDYKGFQDFKLKLSSELAPDSVDNTNVPGQIAEEMKDAVGRTQQEISYDDVLNVASKIISARHVFLSAVGSSAIAATALKYKLLKAGIQADTSPDPHIQSTAIANLGADDIVVLISVSGSTKDILYVAEQAKSQNVQTLAITNYLKSPLIRYADHILYNCKKEAPNRGGSLATVVSQMYIVDVLCCAIYERLGQIASERSARATEAVSDKLV